MKLSDYIVDYLAEKGVGYIFFISGGAAVHLVDSADRHPKIRVICNQHEQYAGTAADGYSRINGLGAAIVTSGPGATNLLTAISNCFYDSIPCIFLTGQVATFRIRQDQNLRQKGFQETPVAEIFKPITKYAVQITDPKRIRYELEKAVYLATTPRKGPVVLDIPDDLQRAEINPRQLAGFRVIQPKKSNLKKPLTQLLTYISQAKRPVVIGGAGVSLSGARAEFKDFIEKYQLPAVFSWGGADLLPSSHPLNHGVIGVCGPRGGNFAVQTADLVIAVGTRLSQLTTGGKQNLFAPLAKKIMIDIDAAELDKFTPTTFVLNMALQTDIKDFFTQLSKQPATKGNSFKVWNEQIKAWTQKYPICPPDYYKESKTVSPYVFVKELAAQCKKNAVLFADTGANLSWTLQNFEFKTGQRLHSAWSQTPMGYALPASIGAAFATKKEIICLIGDGGLMMCLAELATVKHHKLPIKIFLFNNHGHSIQKQTMDTWLNSRYVAADTNSGLVFPDFNKIGKAFELPVIYIKNHRKLKMQVKKALAYTGPVFVNVEITPGHRIIPMLKFGSGLEDLDPKLPQKELAAILTAH